MITDENGRLSTSAILAIGEKILYASIMQSKL